MGLYPVCSGGSRAINGKISPQRHDYKAIKTVHRANVAFFNCNRGSLKEKIRMANWRPYQNTVRSGFVEPGVCCYRFTCYNPTITRQLSNCATLRAPSRFHVHLHTLHALACNMVVIIKQRSLMI